MEQEFGAFGLRGAFSGRCWHVGLPLPGVDQVWLPVPVS